MEAVSLTATVCCRQAIYPKIDPLQGYCLVIWECPICGETMIQEIEELEKVNSFMAYLAHKGKKGQSKSESSLLGDKGRRDKSEWNKSLMW